MLQTIEAVIDEPGVIHLSEAIRLSGSRRALVTILDEEPLYRPGETALLSEAALAADWHRPEEDEVWAYLQSEPGSWHPDPTGGPGEAGAKFYNNHLYDSGTSASPG
jgi:hypothetical protein